MNLTELRTKKKKRKALEELWEVHTGSVWEGHHPVGGTAHGTWAMKSDHEGAVEMK